MFLIAALALFAAFLANVLLGATGGVRLLGDVGEMVLLFSASVLFVIAILRREAAEKDRGSR